MVRSRRLRSSRSGCPPGSASNKRRPAPAQPPPSTRRCESSVNEPATRAHKTCVDPTAIAGERCSSRAGSYLRVTTTIDLEPTRADSASWVPNAERQIALSDHLPLWCDFLSRLTPERAQSGGSRSSRARGSSSGTTVLLPARPARRRLTPQFSSKRWRAGSEVPSDSPGGFTHRRTRRAAASALHLRALAQAGALHVAPVAPLRADAVLAVAATYRSRSPCS